MAPSGTAIVDSWTRLGLLGALLAAGVVFVHVPVIVWTGNVAEFHAPLAHLLIFSLAALLTAMLVCLTILRLLPPAARAGLACLLCAIGLVWWGYGTQFVGHMAVLDGQGAPMDFQTALGVWELPLAAAGVLLLAFGIGRKRGLASFAVLTLNVGLFVATAVTVVSSRSVGRQASGVPPDEAIFRFSPASNVLVILLDGLQADVAARALAEPALEGAFEGFQFYKDTLAAAPTTFLSLPAIHSGAIYEPGQIVRDYFTDAIEHRSFMTRFAAAGYDTALVNPIEGLCPDGITACTAAAPILRPRSEQARLEALRLLDLSLFRVSPVRLKRHIYDDGNWFVSRQMAVVDHWTDQILQGNRLLEEMGERLAFNDGAPTLKFLHSMSTHTPYILADDCQTVVDTTLERLPAQTRCALLAVATLLDRMKQARIYDEAVILVLADHGINSGVYPAARPGSHNAWRYLAGGANPLFLLKRRGASGALQEASGAVSLADVGATLCAASDACATPLGTPAGQAPADRLRRFNEYVWREEFWRLRDLPDVTPHEVRGPLWKRGSWRSPD
jgi:hypothetical protein